jgi:hypothetical protein
MDRGWADRGLVNVGRLQQSFRYRRKCCRRPWWTNRTTKNSCMFRYLLVQATHATPRPHPAREIKQLLQGSCEVVLQWERRCRQSLRRVMRAAAANVEVHATRVRAVNARQDPVLRAPFEIVLPERTNGGHPAGIGSPTTRVPGLTSYHDVHRRTAPVCLQLPTG